MLPMSFGLFFWNSLGQVEFTTGSVLLFLEQEREGEGFILALIPRQRLVDFILKYSSQLLIPHVLQLQSQLLTYPIPSETIDPNIIAVKLIGICASNGNIYHAELIFSSLADPNIFACNSILRSLSQTGDWSRTILHFNRILSSPHPPFPDHFTFTSVLKACAGTASATAGGQLHAAITKSGFEDNLFVRNSLIDMYFKLGSSSVAGMLFEEMQERDIVSWNTLVSGHCLSGDIKHARSIFDGMSSRNVVSWSTMISGYARAGLLDEARHLFDDMPARNVVCWNAMIAGYSHNEEHAEAIEIFRSMQRAGTEEPNDVTVISVLSACGHLCAIGLGKWIDQYVSRRKMHLSLVMGNALTDMYAKCGCIVEAERVFEKMREKDVVTWSTMISGLAMYGRSHESLSRFAEMQGSGIKPNGITFIGLLTACTHSGLVDKGMSYFNAMEEEYGVLPTVEHYGCVVDLISRAGRLKEAEDLILSMPMEPNVIVWGSLLGGCRKYKDNERGRRAVQRILELDPEHSGGHVYLASIYVSAGKVDVAARCREQMHHNGVVKTPGCSWIEVGNRVHGFFVGDRSHPQSELIYAKVGELRLKMKLAGYEPSTDLVSQSVEEEEKEDALSTHSEKLAVAFGLLHTAEGTTIRVVKNLRICEDCHFAFEIISKITSRGIIVRDRSRFHCFTGGKCSCGDYW